MAIYATGRSFLSSERPEYIPEPALAHWERLGVDLDDQTSSQLRVHTSAVDDWWFNLLEGNGRVKVNAESLRSSNYDLLIWTIRGGYQGHPLPTHVPPFAGELMLSRWEDVGDLVCTNDFSLLCACIPPAYLNKLTLGKIPYGRPISAYEGCGAVLGASFRTLAAEAMLRSGSTTALSLLLPDFTRLALTALANAETHSQKGLNATRSFSRAIEYIDAHLSDADLSPTTVSDECAMSVRHLHRMFAQRNQTFIAYLQNRRLELAIQLLLDKSQRSVSEIAYRSGFSSPTVFSRLFRRAYGASPREFRDRAPTKPPLPTE